MYSVIKSCIGFIVKSRLCVYECFSSSIRMTVNDSVNTGVGVNVTLNYDGTVYRLPTGSLPSQEVSSNVFCYTKQSGAI